MAAIQRNAENRRVDAAASPLQARLSACVPQGNSVTGAVDSSIAVPAQASAAFPGADPYRAPMWGGHGAGLTLSMAVIDGGTRWSWATAPAGELN
jgi:hypothetical protein